MSELRKRRLPDGLHIFKDAEDLGTNFTVDGAAIIDGNIEESITVTRVEKFTNCITEDNAFPIHES